MLSPPDFSRARKRLLQMHFESGVGHIGGNLSALDAMLVVFHEFLGKDDPFILSKGHSAGALYTALWSAGRLADDDLKTFHRDNTLLAGHPPAGGIPDIPFATGSLGHGLSLAAGTALGLRLKGSGSRVFCLTSDGEWQEGSTWEALIFACHHQLENLTVLVDHNNLQGFGSTADVASMSPLWERLKGFDADVQVIDGHDPEAIRAALAVRGERLGIIILKTVKGHGVRLMENRMEWHYLPLNEAQYTQAAQEIDSL
ncbi:MAG: transketolase [Thermomonas sp.]